MTQQKKRQPAGQRTGGQFAPDTSGRSGVASPEGAPVGFPGLPAPVNFAQIADPSERLAAIQAEQDALHAAIDPVQERLRALRQAAGQAREDRAAQLEVTPETMRELFELSWSDGVGNRTASEKLAKHMVALGVPGSSAHLRDHMPAVDELPQFSYHVGLHYDSPKVMVDWNTSDADIDTWAAGYAAYAGQVSAATGVNIVRFSIMDAGLSQFDSHEIQYVPETGEATLYSTRRHTVRMTGTLAEVLRKVRSDLPYQTHPSARVRDDW